MCGGYRLVHYKRPGQDRRAQRQWRRKVNTLLRLAVVHGVAEVALPKAWHGQDESRQLSASSYHRFLVVRDINEPDEDSFDGQSSELSLPRVSVLDPASKRFPDHLLEVERPLHLIVVPEDLSDPGHPDRNFIDIRLSQLLDELLEVLRV